VEDRIRCGKDTGFGRFPSRVFAINAAWLQLALTAIGRLAWTQLLTLDGELAAARTQEAALPTPARRRPHHPQRPKDQAAHRRNLALGNGSSRRLHPPARTATARDLKPPPPTRPASRSNPATGRATIMTRPPTTPKRSARRPARSPASWKTGA